MKITINKKLGCWVMECNSIPDDPEWRLEGRLIYPYKSLFDKDMTIEKFNKQIKDGDYSAIHFYIKPMTLLEKVRFIWFEKIKRIGIKTTKKVSK